MPYYAGDPGFFSFVKKAVKGVGGLVGSPLGNLAMSVIPGGGLIKTGLGLLGSMAGSGGGRAAMEPGHVTGGTPGAVAQAAGLVARAKQRVRRVARVARRRRRR